MPVYPNVRRTGAVVVGLAAVGLLATQLAAGAATPRAAAAGVVPRSIGDLDCNGYSTIQRPATPRKLLCTDISGLRGGRFYDNSWYIGHDEPSIRFLSDQPGSGTDVTFTERLGADPAAIPTVSRPGHDVTHWFELTPAPWYGMSICDPHSYPETPCRPESDANAPHGGYPGGGGAFMEMQFYPPGFAPFDDAVSCNNTDWCAALTIDSLECTANGLCNNKCVEPVNFAFISRDGVPAGPPSPQLADLATFTPNRQTLMMRPGDVVRTHLFDADVGHGRRAFEVRLDDLTTGQSGWMVASAANGFMNTDPYTCDGTPFNFQPLFNTARPQNSIRWSVLLSGILSEYEIGHFTPCTRLTQPFTLGLSATVTDKTWKLCRGPYETSTGPDGTKSNPEAGDALCYPAGDTHGMLHSAPDEVTGCLDNYFQNGDLDFDGTDYWPDYPNSVTPDRFPSTFQQRQPTTVGGRGYPQLQFETDVDASEFTTCVYPHLSGCAVPPPTAPGHFYPYWTQASVGGACVWEFGQMSNGNSFGGDGQYSHLVEHGFFPHQYDSASPVRANPAC